MIAVFAEKHPELTGIYLRPEKEFKLIKSVEDLSGHRFTGLILIGPCFYLPVSTYKDFKTLERLQPGLFKK